MEEGATVFKCDHCHVPFASAPRERLPMTVGCFHTLCGACVAEAAKANKSSGGGGTLRLPSNAACCPLCGEDMEHAGQGVQVRESVLQHVEELENAGLVEGDFVEGGEGGEGGGGEGEADLPPPTPHALCEVCEETHAATHFCKQCSQSMCSHARGLHLKMRMAMDHNVDRIRQQSPMSARAPTHCPIHNQPLVLACVDDMAMVCLECATTTHLGHKFKKPQQAVDLMRDVMGVGDERAREMQAAEAALKATREEVMAAAKEAETDINNFFDEIEAHRQHLLSAIRKVKKDTTQRLNDVCTTSRVIKQGVESIRKAIAEARGGLAAHNIAGVLKMGVQLQQLLAASQRLDITPHLVHIAFHRFPLDLTDWKRRCMVTAHSGSMQVAEKRLLSARDPEASMHAQRGLWFAVRAKNHPLTLASVVGGVTGPEGAVRVFCKRGLVRHVPLDESEWKEVGEGELEERKATELKLRTPVHVPANDVVSVLVHSEQGQVCFSDPHDGAVGDMCSESDEAVMLFGSHHRNARPFDFDGIERPFALAGGVAYQVRSSQAVLDAPERLLSNMTPELSNNAERAVWFDVRTKSQALFLTALVGGVYEQGDVLVYVCRTGSGIDKEAGAGHWTKVAEGRLGVNRTTELPFWNAVYVPPDSVIGVYCVCIGGKLRFDRGGGGKGTLHTENEDAQIVHGGWAIHNVPFEAPAQPSGHTIAGGVVYRRVHGSTFALEGIPRRLNTAKQPETASQFQYSVWFDVRAKNMPVTIHSLFGGSRARGLVSVFAREGSGVNHGDSAEGWRRVGQGYLRNGDQDGTCVLRLSVPVHVRGRSVVGLLVHCGEQLHCTDPDHRMGDVHVENDEVVVMYGRFSDHQVVFEGRRDDQRLMIAGGVGYSVGGALV